MFGIESENVSMHSVCLVRICSICFNAIIIFLKFTSVFVPHTNVYDSETILYLQHSITRLIHMHITTITLLATTTKEDNFERSHFRNRHFTIHISLQLGCMRLSFYNLNHISLDHRFLFIFTIHRKFVECV